MNHKQIFLRATQQLYDNAKNAAADFIQQHQFIRYPEAEFLDLEIPRNLFDEEAWQFLVENSCKFYFVWFNDGEQLPVYKILGDLLYQ